MFYVAIKTTSINVRITPELRANIQAAADYRGISLSSMAHSILVKAIRELRQTEPEVFGNELKRERSVYANIEKSFDLTAAIGDIGDPYVIMNQWFTSEGRALPQDYSVGIFFGGWETFSPAERHEALVDAKKVLDRTLKTRHEPKGKIAGRIEPGIKQKQKAEAQKMIDAVELQPRKRKAK